MCIMLLRIAIPTLSVTLLLSACQSSDNELDNEQRILGNRQIYRLIPARTMNRMAWANDMRNIMDELKIERNLSNVCSIVAVVDQESNFVADPAVPGLGRKAAKEMNERLEKKLGKKMADYFDEMMEKYPTPDDSFMNRLEHLHTERELDLLYREMFEFYTKHYHVYMLTSAAKLIARQDLAETFNPVKTLGSMQVHIRYATENSRSGGNINKIRDDLYTQYGGMYYGIDRLMNYQTEYDKPIYRFADYNSGMYSSRNASFQKAIQQLTNQPLTLDGDLLSYDKDGEALADTTNTEKLINQVFKERNIPIGEGQVRRDLHKEKEQGFENTDTYKQVRQLYQTAFGETLPYAIMPQVTIEGPKLSRQYNTNWYASRVNGRYTRCLSNGRRMGFKYSDS